jgi:hypothetical protein
MTHLSLWNLFKNLDGLYRYKHRYRTGQSYLRSIEDRRREIKRANPENEMYKIMSGTIEHQRQTEFSETLDRFVKTAEADGIHVLIALIPDSVQLNDPHMQAVNRFIAQVCSEKGIPFVDLTPFLEAEKDHLSLYLFPYDAHHSPRGLRVIARSIAKHIIELKLLPSSHSHDQ